MTEFHWYTHTQTHTRLQPCVRCLSTVSAPIKWKLDRGTLLINTNHRNNYSLELKYAIDF